MTTQDGPIEWPTMERYSDIPMFNTKAVVQQTGVPAPTLRAWERRYKLILPQRAGNTYRLYSERDINTIRWLKKRVDNGMTISKAIALFRHLEQEYHQSLQQHPIIEPGEDASPSSTTREAKQADVEQDMPEQAEEALQAQSTLSYQLEPGHETIQNHYPNVHNMLAVRENLIEAFDNLDEQIANMLTRSMLSIYPIEQVCIELIIPTMWEVGQRWSEGHMTVPAEHFASNFFRGLLTNLYHIAAQTTTGPLILVCCAPGESHELAVLMLALFLRRRGMHIVYLGQSIEITGIIQVIQRLTPALICVSLTMPSYLAALIDLSRNIAELPSPRPIFAFGGQAFCQYPGIISQIPGIYLEDDLISITTRLQHIVADRNEQQN